MAANTCLNIQKSLGWCQGTPELPGIMRRLYYIAKSSIVKWPMEKARVFDPIGHAGFDPSGKIRLTP